MDLIERMDEEIAAWDDDEPRADWYQYQHDFAEAAAELRTLRAEREAEVAEIVAWLAADAADTMRKLHAAKKLTPTMTVEWEALIAAKAGIAAAIERREYKEPKP